MRLKVVKQQIEHQNSLSKLIVKIHYLEPQMDCQINNIKPQIDVQVLNLELKINLEPQIDH